MTVRPSLTRAARKPKFRVGQVVAHKKAHGIFYKVMKIHISREFGVFYYTFNPAGWGWKEEEVRPLTKRERGQ